jgi:hypothetical protein
MTSFYFYGVIDGEPDTDPMWKILHDHFEKLARQDDDAKQVQVTDRKAVKRKR